MGRVRVFIACSLDGFIAGEGNDLSFLPQPDPGSPDADDGASDDAGYGDFMATVGAVVVGRTTFDVVAAMGLPGSPWGERPALVVTHRPLPPSAWPTARAVAGDIDAIVAEARQAAGDGDVYLDGGQVIRAALDKDLIDELTVTIVPAILGRGSPLFAGAAHRHRLTLVSSRPVHSGMVQTTWRPKRQTP